MAGGRRIRARRAQQAAVRDRADARRRRDGADRRPDRQGNPRCAARCAGGRCHPVHLRGAAYGLRQSLDTVGAFLGPLLAVIIMLGWHDDFRLAFWLAVIPGVLAVALLAFGIEEPARAPGEPRVNPIRRDIVAQLGARYWWVVAVGAACAGPLQRSVPGAARDGQRRARRARAARDGGDERRVCIVGLPVRQARRHDEPQDADGGRAVLLLAADIVLAHGTHWGTVPAGVAL